MKIMRAYAVAVMICFSLTAITACLFIADENARKISFGSENAVAVISSTDENLYENSVNFSHFIESLKDATKKAASFAPPPVSNIYWFMVNSENLLN